MEHHALPTVEVDDELDLKFLIPCGNKSMCVRPSILSWGGKPRSLAAQEQGMVGWARSVALLFVIFPLGYLLSKLVIMHINLFGDVVQCIRKIPLRRARGAATRSAPYISGVWRSRCHVARRALDGDGDGDGNNRPEPEEHESTPSVLQDDALAAVFARLLDGPAVVRSASSCRRWGRVVCKEAASLSRTLPLLGSLALGFFHQDVDAGRRQAANGPIFAPTTSATRLLGFRVPSLLEGVHVDLECSRPVASRNARLVLELRREWRADGLRLCICNPMTGDADLLPQLCGEDMPGYDYACAFLTGDDVEPPVLSPAYHRLLLVYNRRGFTALRKYSSDTTSWGPEAKADARISNGWLRNMVQATALRGVVYWPLAWHVLGVRLDSMTMEQYTLPYGCSQPTPVNKSRNLTIGVSPEGRLCLVIMVMHGRHTPRVLTQNFDITVGRWGPQDTVVNLDQFRLKTATAMTSRCYCDKSGVLFFTLGEGSSIRGTFALNLKTKEIDKIANRESWTSFYGYEMGRDMYLRSLLVPP
ncbi:hypothetical protein ACQ4PT_057890 [Festuca glaucescens]